MSFIKSQKEEISKAHSTRQMMNLLSQSVSFPKISYKSIENLLSQKKSPQLQSNNSPGRFTFNKKNNQEVNLVRFNRYTEADYKIEEKDFGKLEHEDLKVKSPFYKRVEFKTYQKCECQFHRLKKNVILPGIKKGQQFDNCHHMIKEKIQDIKRFHMHKANSVRQEHSNNHQKIQKNNFSYLAQSLKSSQTIKQQKKLLSQKNNEQFENKLQQTKSEKRMKKEFRKIFFKEKLDKIYNLDNQNQPYQKVLEKRNIWQKQKKLWHAKIYKKIQSKLIQVKNNKEKHQKNKEYYEYVQEEKNLLDIEKCLGIILNYVSSINEIKQSQEADETHTKIDSIFLKNLSIQSKQYPKKLTKKFKRLIQEVIYEDSLPKEQFKKEKELSFENFHLALSPNDQSAASQTAKVSSQQIDQKIPRVSSLIQPLSLESKSQSSANQLVLLVSRQKPEVSTHEKKLSILSNKSVLSKKKLSTISKKSLLSSCLTKRKDSNFEQDQKQTTSKVIYNNDLKEEQNTSVKKMVLTHLRNDSVPSNQKKTPYCSINATPSISKQVINENQELNLTSQSEVSLHSYDSQKEFMNNKALKFIQVAKQYSETEKQQQIQRINYVIDFIKTKVRMRKMNTSIIPPKYQQINYEKYCSQSTFRYITSMVDDFKGTKKFRFLYGQLAIKKRILEDQWVESVIKEFRPMFEDQNQFKNWKSYIFEHRSKIMFQKLNRMIDQGMKETPINKVQSVIELKDEPSSQNRTEGCAIFNLIDQSQLAYERYLQKLERKVLEERNSIKIIQRDLHMLKKHMENQSQDITQKTIQDGIEQSSTKTILYSCVQNERSGQNTKRDYREIYDEQEMNSMEKQNKKKILKYLIKKNPKQFQKLSKNVNEFNHYVHEAFRG